MKIHKLRDLLLIKNGRDHSVLSDGEIPVYGSGGIMRYANKSIYNDESILLPRKGTLSNIQYVNKPFWSVDTIYYTIVNKDLADPFFLFNYLKSLDLSNLNTGTGVPSMTFESYYNLEIKLPSISIQKKIASVLSSLDSKIELNNRINAELEQMAKTIYDYWFVQFDFPISPEYTASVGQPELEGKPYRSSGGKMVWSEELKREVPEGWEVKKLENVINKIIDNRGKTPLKLGGDWSQDSQGVIALSAKHVKDGKLIKLEDANVVTFEMFEKWMPNKLEYGDILMTSEAPCGEFYMILNDTNYCLSQRLFAMRAENSKVYPSYLYYELAKGNGYSQIIGKQSGSTVFGIRQDELRTVNILVPNLALQRLFDEKVKPMLLQIRTNEAQSRKLTELRDWLLPMLMNGQVRVGHVDEEGVVGMAEDAVGAYIK